jgi:hypothetical protein
MPSEDFPWRNVTQDDANQYHLRQRSNGTRAAWDHLDVPSSQTDVSGSNELPTTSA